jgi:DNA polymerase-3 subunit gamma/tau
MKSLVLYRKYRPQKFSEFIGQEHVVKTLTNAILSGMISHAYLFSGPRGTGKTTLARLLAKAVNCQNRKENEFEPCNKCNSCQEITTGNAIDLIEIDAASHRGIDDIRELREGIKFAPAKSKYKVFIIDECHQLSKDAANALLKTLEEPPPHAIFILATTEVHKMIPTIVSRCQRFDFRKLRAEEIVEKLERIAKAEKVKIEEAALELIALYSSGSIRDGESLLDELFTFAANSKKEIKAEEVKNLLGLVETELVSQFIDLILEKNASKAINFLQNEVSEKGLDLREFSRALINYLRQGLILKLTGVGETRNPIVTGLTKEELEKLKKQVEAFKTAELEKAINLFLEAQTKMKYSPIPQLPLELAIIDSCGIG